jgi:hypothetical protein
MPTLRVLLKRNYLIATVVLAFVLSLLYLQFSLRSAGMNTTIFTLTRATPRFEVDTFGIAFYGASVVLDLLIASLTAILMVWTYAAWRTQRSFRASAAGGPASLLVAATTFG